MRQVLFTPFIIIFHTYGYSQLSSKRTDRAKYVDSMAYYMDSIGNYPSAISYYTQSIQLHSSKSIYDVIRRGMSYNSRAADKKNLQDYRGAIADYTILISISPKNDEAFFERGICKSRLNDPEGAIKDFNAVIRLDPKNNIAYLNRGISRLALKQKESACLDFSKAGELGYDQAYEMINKYCN